MPRAGGCRIVQRKRIAGNVNVSLEP